MDPNNEELKWRAHFHLVTWDQTFKHAEDILNLAKQHQEQSKMLSSCAAVIFAAVLDQGTWSKLELAFKSAVDQGNDPASYFNRMEASLRERVFATPSLLTDGQMELDSRSPRVQSLHKLISLRNGLLHIRERAVTMQTGDPGFRWDEGKLEITNIQFPSNPWSYLTLAEAYEFREVVALYIREVLDPAEIVEGEIVKKV